MSFLALITLCFALLITGFLASFELINLINSGLTSFKVDILTAVGPATIGAIAVFCLITGIYLAIGIMKDMWVYVPEKIKEKNPETASAH